MANAKLVQLIRLLVEKTERGDLDWQESSNDRQFLVSFPQYSVSISTYSHGENYPWEYIIGILDSSGRVIESFDTEDDQIDLGEGATAARAQIARVFQKARRRALKVDEALDGLLKELDK